MEDSVAVKVHRMQKVCFAQCERNYWLNKNIYRCSSEADYYWNIELLNTFFFFVFIFLFLHYDFTG